MKTVKILTATLGLLAITSPALAQNEVAQARASVAQMEKQNRAFAARVGTERLDPAKAHAPYTGKVNLDQKRDPWIPVTSEAMNRTNQDIWTRKANYSLSVQVDYDGDGHLDTARMYNNSRQGAVIVTFGGGGQRAPAIAFKTDMRFLAGEEIFAAGPNRITVSIPDARTFLLFTARGAPRVITYGE